MPRPTVLLIDPQAERLRDIGTRVAAEGYEVVPVADTARAARFAGGFGEAVIVTTGPGRLLGIKPILGVVDGEVAPVDRAFWKSNPFMRHFGAMLRRHTEAPSPNPDKFLGEEAA